VRGQGISSVFRQGVPAVQCAAWLLQVLGLRTLHPAAGTSDV